jgi:C4-dicarboxylate-specific signal transduction histidine kinase
VALRSVIQGPRSRRTTWHRARLLVELEADATVWASEPRLSAVAREPSQRRGRDPRGAADDNRIVVTSHKLADGRVRVEVLDTGRGISREVAAHIFEPFWTDKPAGMGLGLAICLGIVTSLGGEIFVESPDDGSNAPGRGSRFVVVRPAGEEAERHRGLHARCARKEPRGRVFIVDDEVA